MTSNNVRLIISGKVQGVYYRDWTVEAALGLNLSGWVRNLSDGTVEAILSGDASNIENMVQLCKNGPDAAIVDDVKIFDYYGEPEKGFYRKPTCDPASTP